MLHTHTGTTDGNKCFSGTCLGCSAVSRYLHRHRNQKIPAKQVCDGNINV